MHFSTKALAALIGSATSASAAILWDGRFDSSTMAELQAWSWSHQAGHYQNYIHGPGKITQYVALDGSYKNPADSGSALGAKITLDSTSFWNGQNMRRTELIPQTAAAIVSGKVYYHFSIKHSATNPPSTFREHQIAFFESHFTEMKSGWDSGKPTLGWFAGSGSKWSTNWDADVWHNIAYGIDFSAGSVEFYHSTGSDALTLTVPAVKVSASSNGADWHVGVLELPVAGQADATEDFYFSGVYIESGSLTTNVAGPGGAVSPNSPSPNPPSTNIPAPNTPAPNTPAPNTPAPNTPAPNTPAPNTPAPNTPAPNTPAPNTPAPPPAGPRRTKKKPCTKKPTSTPTGQPPTKATRTKKPCTKKPTSTPGPTKSKNPDNKKNKATITPTPAPHSRDRHTTFTKTATPGASATATPAPCGNGYWGSSILGKYQQCGGTYWQGCGTCVAGTHCQKHNDFYYQCVDN